MSAPCLISSPPPIDVAPFGILETWAGPSPRPLPGPADAAAQNDRNLGVEWREVRDVRQVDVTFAQPVPDAEISAIKLQYWFFTWPAPRPKMPKINDPVDDRWQGRWLTAETTRECTGNTCRFRFRPLAAAENPNALNLPGLDYRRTLKIRLDSDRVLPAISAIHIYTDSVEHSMRLRLSLGYGEPAGSRWAGSLEVFGGRLETARPWNFTPRDRFDGPGRWSFTRTSSGQGLLLDLIAAEPTLPGSLDHTLVTVRATTRRGSIERPANFTFDTQDLKKGPINIPDLHACVSLASESPEACADDANRKGARIRTLIPKEPEQTYQRASREIPPLDPWRMLDDSRVFLPLAPDSSWQKFAVDYGGNVYISKRDAKLMGQELARVSWPGDTITWKIGTGKTPYYRDDGKAEAETLDGFLPVVIQRWKNDGLLYREEAFATVLRGPLAPAGRNEQIPAILMLRLSARNASSEARPAYVWLSLNPAEKLEIRGTRIYATEDAATRYSKPPLRAVFAGAPLMQAGPHRVRVSFPIPPHSTRSVVLKLPFPSDLDAAAARELAALDYARERERVITYWRKAAQPAGLFSVPEPSFEALLHSVISHLRISATKDPDTGLFMAPAAGYQYKVYANETCYQALLLDQLGDHAAAAAYLEPLMRYQGSADFPGLHHGMEDAIFHGVRVSPDYDYTASNYGLDHGTVLWALAQHYLYSRDKAWFAHAWPHIEKAIAWIELQRSSTRKLDSQGQHIPEYGLLPASHLEDNNDWANWFAINSYAWAGMDLSARALADLHYPKAAEVRREADAYRSDLRAAVLRAVANAPVTELRDGSYVPYVPVEPYQRFRRFGPLRVAEYTRYGIREQPNLRLSATREALYGPIILLSLGVFSPDEPIADWILDDWEDNLTLTSGLGLNVHGLTDDRYWFSQGGMVFQANLQSPFLAYLRRHEIPAAIRSLYNSFVSLYYPKINMLAEEYRMWRSASGPFYKVSDECRFLSRLRDTLVLEDGETLWLGSGMPRRWLSSPEGVRVDHAPTYFGPVSFRMKAGAKPSTIDAFVSLPTRNPPSRAWLVVRIPGRRILRVVVNGHPWTRIDTRREAIDLPLRQGALQIRIAYRRALDGGDQ